MDINKIENSLLNEFNYIDEICEFNSNKVLTEFKKNKVSESDFNYTTGYGYNDTGRDKIEKVYSGIFKSEDALVRSQFISGSHTLTVALFALLRPGDTMLCISGLLYDTLHEVIGIKDNDSSLKTFNIDYKQIDLINDDFDYEKIKETLNNTKIKLVYIQRSKGYSNRKSISLKKVEKVINLVKSINKDIIVMVDNCYCEFTCKKEPIEVGADIVVGSLIKNMGGGIANNGGYIVGKKNLIKLCAERLNLPGEGKEVGPSLNSNRSILQGLFMSPSIVRNALKVAVLASKVFEEMGYKVEPRYNEERCDIVQSIIFNDRNKLISFARSIQNNSPIDSNVTLSPSITPGYKDEIIMASGSFTQGSSIELSCDGPLREPFTLYLQGSLTYEYGKIALINAIKELEKY